MPKNVLVIDDSKTFRKYATVALGLEWPQVQVHEYDPIELGRPAEDFPWADYDVLLLDYQLGYKNETGLDWLADFVKSPDLPITIILTGEGNEKVAVKAMKLGANDYVTKSGQAFGTVIKTIREAVDFRIRTEKVSRQNLSEVSNHPKLLSSEEISRVQSGNWPVRGDRRDTTVTLTPEELSSVRKSKGGPHRKKTLPSDSGVSLPPGYRFVSELGEKALSIVVLAEREEDGKQVVLKVLSTIEVGDDPAAFKRFIQEYTLIAHVSHPHIVSIYEQNFSLDHAFIAMEYFPKGNLADRIEKGLTRFQALSYLREMAYGLRAVHNMTIVHRDLKPGNILFRNDGSLALTDFGIAKILRGRQSLTLDGVVIGTPNYMSPEQATGDEADTRSDLYSLGILFYEMLVGKLPFQADDVIGLLYAHVHRDPPNLPDNLADIQPIMDKLLAKKATDRFDNVDELLQAMGELDV